VKAENKKKRPKGSPLIKMGNKHPIPLANEQRFFYQGVCQNVCKLASGINIAQFDVAILIMITKKVKANINVLGPRM
jgi:hypothetical protein